MYIGKPAIAIFMSDYTKKIRDKLNRLQRQEEFDSAQQSENFTSTVSHEMRTPLFSIQFFLKQIMTLLYMTKFPLDRVVQSR